MAWKVDFECELSGFFDKDMLEKKMIKWRWMGHLANNNIKKELKLKNIKNK